MNEDTTNARDDGLEWLREIRRRMLKDAGGDLKALGDRYRRVEAGEAGKVIDPRKLLAEAVRKAAV